MEGGKKICGVFLVVHNKQEKFSPAYCALQSRNTVSRRGRAFSPRKRSSTLRNRVARLTLWIATSFSPHLGVINEARTKLRFGKSMTHLGRTRGEYSVASRVRS